MSTGSCVVRSHRAKSRSQREVCAASALDFELDIVTRWDLVFFLWKMRVCSVWEEEYAHYLIAREGGKCNQDSSRRAGF